ncbi:10069_t:CDS:2, partial [Gigaspora margarita]
KKQISISLNMTTIDESPAQNDTAPLLQRNAPRNYDAISEPTFAKHVTVENTLSYSKSALVVKNDGSTARDYFAIERTFLSWLRLGVALVLTGLSIYSRFHLVPQSTTMPNHVDAL